MAGRQRNTKAELTAQLEAALDENKKLKEGLKATESVQPVKQTAVDIDPSYGMRELNPEEYHRGKGRKPDRVYGIVPKTADGRVIDPAWETEEKIDKSGNLVKIYRNYEGSKLIRTVYESGGLQSIVR